LGITFALSQFFGITLALYLGARFFSVAAAITASGLLLLPAMWLIGKANGISAEERRKNGG
jgi:hypothetical protein